MTLHAKITAHNNFLVIELLAENSIAGEVTTSIDNPGNFGQVIHNTKKHLGISPEAIALLKKVKRSGDSIDLLDWFRTSDGGYAFAWMGGPCQIAEVGLDAMAARGFTVSEHYVPIANEVPEGALAAINGTPSED